MKEYYIKFIEERLKEKYKCDLSITNIAMYEKFIIVLIKGNFEFAYTVFYKDAIRIIEDNGIENYCEYLKNKINVKIINEFLVEETNYVY